jgi:hypothetical protein
VEFSYAAWKVAGIKPLSLAARLAYLAYTVQNEAKNEAKNEDIDA